MSLGCELIDRIHRKKDVAVMLQEMRNPRKYTIEGQIRVETALQAFLKTQIN